MRQGIVQSVVCCFIYDLGVMVSEVESLRTLAGQDCFFEPQILQFWLLP